jgi:hypothetical protein
MSSRRAAAPAAPAAVVGYVGTSENGERAAPQDWAYADYGSRDLFVVKGQVVTVRWPSSASGEPHPFALTEVGLGAPDDGNLATLEQLRGGRPLFDLTMDAEARTTAFVVPRSYNLELYYYCATHGSAMGRGSVRFVEHMLVGPIFAAGGPHPQLAGG